jgi:hypothetical protein
MGWIHKGKLRGTKAFIFEQQSKAYGSAHILLPHLRSTAKRLGYALGVHGSLMRDIDIIAAPWTRDAVDACTLIEELRITVERVKGGLCLLTPDNLHGENKPHGRRAWSLHLCGGPYLDISVAPMA